MTNPDPIVDVVNDFDAVARLFAIQSTSTVPQYRVHINKADVTGNVGNDLTDCLIFNDSDHVEWECTANTPGSAALTLDTSQLNLTWGTTIVALYQLIRSVEYNVRQGWDTSTWVRFPVGHFVLTSPGTPDLDNPTKAAVTGYDKNYLLQLPITDSLAFAYNSTYKDALSKVFVNYKLATADIAEVCDVPGDWAAKKLPAPKNYPLDGSTTGLDVVNALLKESGCRPLFTQANGRWSVQLIPTASLQSPRWQWYAGDLAADQDAAVILHHSSSYTADVWNAPNRWVFIQQGLTFAPSGSDGSGGRYVVNNTSIGPSSQNTVGRIVTTTVFLAALGQSELVTQGKAYVEQELAQAEKINFQTAAWPAARHFDVFGYNHEALPLAYPQSTPIGTGSGGFQGAAEGVLQALSGTADTARVVQAQKWTLPLYGAPMSWETTAVLT